MKNVFYVVLLSLAAVLTCPDPVAAADAAQHGTFVPATGAQGERGAELMQRLHREPYPKGAWGLVGQSLASYWVGDNATGDKAIESFQEHTDGVVPGEDSHENAFHWKGYQIARIVLLFGHAGVLAPSRMSPAAEKAAKELLWNWMAPRTRRSLVIPANDWMLWNSENHNMQAWATMWGGLTLFASDPEYANRKFSDGSGVGELKTAFDEYYKRWIRLRAGVGMFVETGSPSYSKYSLGGFYNLADFATDPELKRLAHEFLDLYWTQWALEQIDGMRGGSRHRSYPGADSIREGGADEVAWYHFALGEGGSHHPGVWCTATSSYIPPALVLEVANRRRELGEYEVTSRIPGLADPSSPAPGYGGEPGNPISGGYQLDPECRSILRRTFAAPEFVLGTSMVAALDQKAWTAISSQNRWDGVIFSGPGSPRIFTQPELPKKGSIYNTEWSVQDRGVLLIQHLATSNVKEQRMFFSEKLNPTEKQGWIFVEAPGAYAAVKVVDGAWKWEADSASGWHSPKQFVAGLGRWLVPDHESTPLVMEVCTKKAGLSAEDFQREILGNSLKRTADRIDYTSRHYQTTLTLFTDYKQPPMINDKPLIYESPLAFDSPLLQEDFKGSTAHLKAFGQEHTFSFGAK